MSNGRLHEDLRRRHEVKSGSNRSFGFVFGAAFAAVGLWPLREGDVRWWALTAGLIVVVLGLWRPRTLAVPNAIWMRFGLLLHRLVSPVVVFALYSLAIVPMGLLLKITRKDLLRLRWSPAATTYWIARGESGGSMHTQF